MKTLSSSILSLKRGPHCVAQNVTDTFAVPKGMQRFASLLGDDGWQVGSASQHGRNWLKRLSSVIDRAEPIHGRCADRQQIAKLAIQIKPAMKPPADRRHAARYGAQFERLWGVVGASDRLCSKRLKPLIPVLLPAVEQHPVAGTCDGSRWPASSGWNEFCGTPVGPGTHLRGLERSAARLCRGRLRGSFGYLFIRYFRADDGADRYRYGLDRVRAGPHARKRSHDRCPQTGSLAVSIPLLGVDFDNDSAFMNELLLVPKPWIGGDPFASERMIRLGSSRRTAPSYDGRSVTEGSSARRRRLPRASLRRGASVRQSVPAFVQAAREDIARVLAPLRCSRNGQGTATDHTANCGSGDAVCRDSCGTGRPWKAGRSSWPECKARGTCRHRSPAFHLEPEDSLADGRERPTHRRPYRRTKPYPKRPSMLEPFEPQIRAWLEADPALSAASVLQRLKGADPSRFTEKSLRTVQMAVKAWRME